jgi:hypothetical protein
MLIHPRGKDRPSHLGPFPLETLPADDGVLAAEAARPVLAVQADCAAPGPLARAADHCRDLFVRVADGTAAARQAPVPADLVRRVVDIKGAAYFLDAAQVGICRVPGSGWLAGCDHPQYGFAAAAGAA